MKPVFFFLLFLNVVFLLWELTLGQGAGRDSRQPAEAMKGGGLESIVLVSETEAMPVVAASKSDPTEGSGAAPEPEAVEAVEAPMSQTGAGALVEEAMLAWSDLAAFAPILPWLAQTDPWESAEISDAVESPGAADAFSSGDSELASPDRVGAIAMTEAPPLVCYAVGPFDRRVEAAQAAAAIGAAGGTAEHVVRKGKVPTSYMVFYGPASTPEEIKANMAMLKDRGFTDLWPLRQGELRGAISLGVYRREETALDRWSRYRADGLDVHIFPRMKERNRPWLRVTWPDSPSALTAQLRGIFGAESGEKIRRTGPCSEDGRQRTAH